LDVRRIKAPELKQRVANALEMVGLSKLRARYPRELSGGQQQRVALARCFVYEPSLILMDEPLAALDRKLRESLQIEIKRLHRQTGATILFVTHDQEEALALSDRICLMNAGRIEQIGTPEQIYETPETLLAAEFIGISNVLRGKVDSSGLLMMTADGPVPIRGAKPGDDVALIVRPEHMTIAVGPGTLNGTVTETVYAGSETRLLVTLGSNNVVTVRCPPRVRKPTLGERVALTWAIETARVLSV
jgi:putative spermidine/putrescine transport system ATP-binding protein